MEEFKPTGGVNYAADTPVNVGQPAELPLDIRASLEVAKVTMDQTVLGLIQLETQVKQLRQFHQIENDVQKSQTEQILLTCKKGVESLEGLRHKYVDFPTKVVDLTNAFFKPVRDGFQQTKDHAEKLLAKRKEAETQAAQRAQENVQTHVVTGGGESVVPVEQNIPLPGNVVLSTRGAGGVRQASDKQIEVKVVDLQAFLKACTSKNERLIWLSQRAGEFVDIRTEKLKMYILQQHKRKIPGLEITEVE